MALKAHCNHRKSTLLNKMTNTEAVLAKDALFATLDPTTRRIELQSGKQALLTDTVSHLNPVPIWQICRQQARSDSSVTITTLHVRLL